jgi:hypothetical protein
MQKKKKGKEEEDERRRKKKKKKKKREETIVRTERLTTHRNHVSVEQRDQGEAAMWGVK